MSQRLFTQRVRQPWELDTDAPEAMRFSPIQWDLYASTWADPSAMGVQQIITGTKGNDALTGTADADVIDGLKGADTMSGAGGDDRYIVDNAKDVVVETASNGIDTVEASVSYKLTENIENLTLTGLAKNGTGNSLNNRLVGNATDNLLDGGLGIDTLTGGGGNDTYVVNVAQDVVEELANEGNDTVQSNVNYVLSSQVENLLLLGKAKLTGTGNELANLLTGNLANNTLRGLDGHDTLQGGGGNDTLIGGTGDDTYEIDGLSDIVQETLGEGNDTVRASVSYRLGDHLENLLLTGALSINATGNASANTLTGNAANNLLDGQGGADTLQGGAGDDTYIVDHVGDVLSELDNEGTDTVRSTVSYQLGAALENLTLTGLGSTNATGNSANNVLTGNDAANVLDGGAGADTLVGGNGDDRYAVDDAGDVVTELASGGSDTVSASVSYQLREQVENLVLTGALNINATGNADANVLTGNTGANVLDGGAGADTMAGGLGDDVYGVDNSADVVSELVGEGVDTVRSSISYLLAESLENLELLGSSDLNGTGNGSANRITGNAGANTLDGQGGADTLAGGAGDDSYVVDHVGDVITELADEGTDTVRSTVSYQLGAALENLTLVGAGAVNGTGNAANNVIVGNDGANILDGAAGADTLAGGLGDDQYVVDNVGDVVTEMGNEGVDTVTSTISYELREYTENLVLAGTLSINATGNTLANKLTGNSAANVLSGGAGADTMVGGSGHDVYMVEDLGDVVTELAGGGQDTVRSTINYKLTANVESLELLGVSDLNGTGNSGSNTLRGNAGANLLDGGQSGDTMSGGQGSDTYAVDDSGDIVIEKAEEGDDLVIAKVSYALSEFVERLNLVSGVSAEGNALANLITGNVESNSLLGNAGNDTLVGDAGNDTLDGGLDIDSLVGGTGNDVYYLDDVSDVILELANEGIDGVVATFSYVLGNTLENLGLVGLENLNGTGNALDNGIFGNVADNQLVGDLGNDMIWGEEGNDTLIGGSGNDSLFGELGDDLLEGGDESYYTDFLYGGAGNDTLIGGAGWSGAYGGGELYGEDGDDTLAARGDHSELFGGNGNDLLTAAMQTTRANLQGQNGNDTLIGADGIETLNGGAGDDSLDAGAGNDILMDVEPSAQLAADTLIGGDGVDLLDADWSSATANVSWRNEAAGLQWVGGKWISGIEKIRFTLGFGNDVLTNTNVVADDYFDGRAGNDSLDGGAGYDTLIGGTGNDSLNGGGEVDQLLGGAGDDWVAGGAGDDQIYGGLGNDWLDGGEGNDTLQGYDTFDSVGGEQDTVVGGNGVDTFVANWTRNTNAISWTNDPQTTQIVEGTTISGIEQLRLNLGSGNDTIINTTLAANDTINGGSGNDMLSLGGGNDSLSGEEGDDDLHGGDGNDTLVGGAGDDILYGDDGDDLFQDQSGNNFALGGKGDDTFYVVSGNSLVDGGEGNDTFNGGNGQSTLMGGDGDDRFYGSSGQHTLIGGNGNDFFFSFSGGTGSFSIDGGDGYDSLSGGDGDDRLSGGAGTDSISGGSGRDTFILNSLDGADIFADFASGVDLLDFNALSLPVGDGDTIVENATVTSSRGGFSNSAELVICNLQIVGAITAGSAAAVIGDASASYSAGQTALFTVNNGSSSAIYYFKAADANSTVSANELTLLATLLNAPRTLINDYGFGP